MVEALPTIIESLMGEAVGAVIEAIGEIVGESTMQEGTATPATMSPKMSCLVGILPVVTMSSNSQLHGSSPCAS